MEKYDRDIVSEVLRLVSSGVIYRDVAKALSIEREDVAMICRAHNTFRHRQGELLSIMTEMYYAGKTTRQISEQLGLNHKTVQNKLRSRGITTTPTAVSKRKPRKI